MDNFSFHKFPRDTVCLADSLWQWLRDVEPATLVFNVFDASEDLRLWVRETLIHQMASINWRVLFLPFFSPLNWRSGQTVSIVDVYREMPELDLSASSPAQWSRSHHGIEPLSASPAWVSLGWDPVKSKHTQFFDLQEERLCLSSLSYICFVMVYQQLLV